MKARTTELYRHFDKDGRLLYVGIAIFTVERLIGHRSVSHWFGEIARVEIERFPTRQAAMHAELLAIEREKPLHNIKGSNLPEIAARKAERKAKQLEWVERGKLIGISLRENACLNSLEATVIAAQRGDWEVAKWSTAWLGHL